MKKMTSRILVMNISQEQVPTPTSAMMQLFYTKCVVVILVLLAEYNRDKKFWKGFLFSCQYLVWNLVRAKWLVGK